MLFINHPALAGLSLTADMGGPTYPEKSGKQVRP